MTTINETCACGATFTVTSEAYADVWAKQWRRTHKHAESVGICGDQPPMVGPDGFVAPYCVLKAGHAGAHGDGEGSHWSQRPRSATESPRDGLEGSSTSKGRGTSVRGAESDERAGER